MASPSPSTGRLVRSRLPALGGKVWSTRSCHSLTRHLPLMVMTTKLSSTLNAPANGTAFVTSTRLIALKRQSGRPAHSNLEFTMSEQEPLLPSNSAHDDPEANNSLVQCEIGTFSRWRANTAEFLESAPLHYLVISLACTPSSVIPSFHSQPEPHHYRS